MTFKRNGPPSPNKMKPPSNARNVPVPFHLDPPNLPKGSDEFGEDPLAKLRDESEIDYRLFRAWVKLPPMVRRFASVAAEEINKTEGSSVTGEALYALARGNRWTARLDAYEAACWEVAKEEQKGAISESLAAYNRVNLKALSAAEAIFDYHARHPDKAFLDSGGRLLQQVFVRLAVVAGLKSPESMTAETAASDTQELTSKLDALLANMTSGDAMAMLEGSVDDVSLDADSDDGA